MEGKIMDYTILWIILSCIGVVGLIVGLTWLFKRLNVDITKLLIILDPLETIFEFIKKVLVDMGIEESELSVYSDTVLDTLEYLKTLDPEIGIESKMAESTAYCEGLLVKFGIDVTPVRSEIIKQIIPILWNLYDAIQKTQTEIEFED
jgi:hypothetical protein